MPTSLIAAGLALGAIGAPAIAHADKARDKSDYMDCINEHNGLDDPVTQETCCILHGGEWIIQPSGAGWCHWAGDVYGRQIPGDISTVTLTPVPTKTPQVGSSRVR
ncbi:hypothetical protein J3E61_003956 [Mycobacterium sp. OAE908]